MTVRIRPSSTSPLIPDVAVPAWAALARALHGIAPPCSTDPEAWFDTDPAPAIEACGWCPARRECLAFAVTAGERAGIWGGRQFPLKDGKR